MQLAIGLGLFVMVMATCVGLLVVFSKILPTATSDEETDEA